MKDGQTEQKQWQKTTYANLIRYVPSGVLFARIRVRGKLIRQSLKTSDLAVGRRKLMDLERMERGAVQNVRDGKLLVKDALSTLRERIQGKTGIKDSTKFYCEKRIEALLESWPNFEKSDSRKVTERDCEQWAARFSSKFSASSFNHTLSLVRQIFAIAIEAGARYDNPAAKIERMPERPKKLNLPTAAKFNEFIAEIEGGGSGKSMPCANLVRFLTYGGFRKTEAANVTWADCDFKKGRIMVWGDPENRTKNGEFRAVPMIPEMRKLLERLKAERSTESEKAPVMQVRECQKAMDRAATKVGIHRLTHHDLRHLFATRCIESGVDIPTVSRWLGHKDGGALAMNTYGHLRDEHSSDMAAKVRFGD